MTHTCALLERICKTRPLDDVRISEIIEEAEVSKPTFYRHFRDKYDLMECYIRRMYDDTFGKNADRSMLVSDLEEYLEALGYELAIGARRKE